jgi:hypothetical protein
MVGRHTRNNRHHSARGANLRNRPLDISFDESFPTTDMIRRIPCLLFDDFLVWLDFLKQAYRGIS